MKFNTYIFTFSNGDEFQKTGPYTACRIAVLHTRLLEYGDSSGLFLDIVLVEEKTKRGRVKIENRKV